MSRRFIPVPHRPCGDAKAHRFVRIGTWIVFRFSVYMHQALQNEHREGGVAEARVGNKRSLLVLLVSRIAGFERSIPEGKTPVIGSLELENDSILFSTMLATPVCLTLECQAIIWVQFQDKHTRQRKALWRGREEPQAEPAQKLSFDQNNKTLALHRIPQIFKHRGHQPI